MIDLKLSKKEKKKQSGVGIAQPSSNGPEYPWGTSLTFEDEQLKKLKFQM